MSTPLRLAARLALLALCWTPALHAADAAGGYPSRPIRLLVPYPPGGTMDVVGRMLGKKLGDTLHQAVVVENRAGAATVIGAAATAAARPDGYTLMLAPNSTITVIPYIYKNLPYKPDSLRVLAQIGTNQFVLSANAGNGIPTLAALLDKARAQPNGVSFGSFGNGNITHLLGELLNQSAGVSVLHVPYQGAAPALNDLLGNNISTMFDAVPNAAPYIQGGKLTGLAVTGGTRSPLIPNVPTFVELGYPDFAVDGWVALIAPAGLEPDAAGKLDTALDAIGQDAGFRQELAAKGVTLSDLKGAPLQALIHRETGIFRKVAEKARIQIE